MNEFNRYGGVATYNGGGNDDYYSGNSYSQGKSIILLMYNVIFIIVTFLFLY